MARRTTVAAGQRVVQSSRILGYYQTLLRRTLEHFFPEAVLEPAGDRSFIGPGNPEGRANYRLRDDPDGLGLGLEWFRTRYLLVPGRPSPFLPSERRLVDAVVRLLDRRFRALFDPEEAHREELFHFATEDLVVAEYLACPAPDRIPAALEALRLAALSTYENRRASAGSLLLGTPNDPAQPDRINPPGAPLYNVRLSALKSLHRICDGLRTLFLVDLQGELAWAVDVGRWAAQVQGDAPLPAPCPRAFEAHARATITGDHVALVLTPAQEIKVFAGGTWAFTFTDARWRLMDLPAKFDAWCRALGGACPSDLALRLFRAALNLVEERKGALIVVLRDPERSVPQLLAPSDRILSEVVEDDPDDPENLSPRLAKRAIHHLVRGQGIAELDASVLESLAGLDGAVVTDQAGRLLSFGAILRVSPDSIPASRAVEGARSTAALAASYHGPVLKVSEDGYMTMYLGGRRVWIL